MTISGSATVRRAAVLLGAAVMVAALAGCGTSAGAPTSVGDDPGFDYGLQQVGDHALLTHPPSPDSDMAALEGVLGADPKGCITVGDVAVVLPSDDQLLEDGGLRRNGRTFAQGDRLSLAGGSAWPPASVRASCVGSSYFIAGSM